MIEPRSRFTPRKPEGISFKGCKRRTKQSFRKECDINTIVRKYIKTGLMPAGNRQPQFGDFTTGNDFRETLHSVMEAEESFAALSSQVRKRFDNDPSKLMDFLNNEENRKEAIELGLIDPEAPAPAPVKVEITNPDPKPE